MCRHEPEALWVYYTQPYYLALYGSLTALLLLAGFLYWRQKANLHRRQRYLNFFLVSHFLFWFPLAFIFFSFLECILLWESFRLVDYTFVGLRIALGLPILAAFILAGLVTSVGAKLLQRHLLANLLYTPPSVALERVLGDLAQRAGLKAVRVIIEETPAAYSLTLYGRPPVIVLTRGLLELLDSGELRAVIAHEMAHIANHDCFYKLFTTILARFLYYDPLIRRLRSSLCRDREFLADEAAARLTSQPLGLATALLKLSRVRSQTSRPLTTSAATMPILGEKGDGRGDHPPVKARVRRLLELHMELGDRLKRVRGGES